MLDVILYIVVFFLIQYAITLGVNAYGTWIGGTSTTDLSQQIKHGTFDMNGKTLVAISVLSSIVTLFVFVKTKWAGTSRTWLRSRPWAALAWVVFLALGAILPSQWLQEQLNLTLPAGTQQLYEAIMGEPAGYLAIGILAPLAEELVFRGAVLRSLLRLFDRRLHWIPIAISAALFGAVHGNLPQFVHATLVGLILGWMYYRTDSIVPGIVYHWVNNTVAYIMFNMMPQMADGKLIDLFHGDHRTMWMGLAFSLCLLLPGLFQLHIRLKNGKDGKAGETR